MTDTATLKRPKPEAVIEPLYDLSAASLVNRAPTLGPLQMFINPIEIAAKAVIKSTPRVHKLRERKEADDPQAWLLEQLGPLSTFALGEQKSL
jgi:hypothetical protein